MPETVGASTQDWVNPLDKIDQLLTCAICLDRYRVPKLLPCQHTFCMEPCLEGLADSVRRLVKCPECRAEHPLPYEGVRAYQTNYTLMGFLEIHLEATSDNAEEFEAYVRRFNLERCRMCNEKGEVDFCAHCEKKICLECKASHTDMLKRDLSRLMNQVKRISGRITEASSSLEKGIGALTVNSDNVKEEIRDNVRRFIKELEKREDTLLTELETFTGAELRLMRGLKENLDMENTNITEACSKIEGCLKDEEELTDQELVKYKQIFTDGLDYLRLFNPDSEDFAIKKVRFQPGSDPQILPHAIGQFGELHVCTTHFNKYQSTDNFVPRFGAIGLEGDNFASRRRTWDESGWLRGGGAENSELERPKFERLGRRGDKADEDNNGRYRRFDARDTRDSRETRRTNTAGMQFNNSPWSRVNEAVEPPVEREHPPSVAKRDVVSYTSRRVIEREPEPEDEELNQRINNIRKEYEKRAGGPGVELEPQRRPRAWRSMTRSINEAKLDDEVEANAADEESLVQDLSDAHPIPITHYPSPSRNIASLALEDHGLKRRGSGCGGKDLGKRENMDWKKYLIPASNQEESQAEPRASKKTLEKDKGLEEKRSRFVRSRTNPDFYGSGSQETGDEGEGAGPGPSVRGSGRGSTELSDHSSGREVQERRSRYRRKVENRAQTTGTTTTSNNSQEEEPKRYEISIGGSDGPSSKYYRVFTTPSVNYLEKGRTLVKFGSKGGGGEQFNWPRGICVIPVTDEIAVCDSSNHRVQIFDQRGNFQRAFGTYGNGRGEFDCLAGICINKYKQFVVTDRYNHRVQIFDSSGKFIREFGAQGQTNGRFQSPWGVVVDSQGFIYVCDKDNHRVQIFQMDGNFVGKFGSIGNREGQFQNPHFIACNRANQLIVSDSSNHRLQVFDHNGHFLFSFGSEGFQDGMLKYPRGLAVDSEGFVIVADSGNNRIQVFYPDGRFYATFGAWGTGDGQLKQVEGIALMPNGRIVVTDRENHRVQVF